MASDGRQRVLNAIIGYITEHQYPPTIREICEMTGLKSTSTVQIHISNLMRDGLLESAHKDSDWRKPQNGSTFFSC